MTFGFPAYYTDSYDIETENDLREAVKKTLRSLGWSIRSRSQDSITAASKMGLRSWGEIITIEFGNKNRINVTSKCSMFTQCFDWGKNKANVDKFIEEMANNI